MNPLLNAKQRTAALRQMLYDFPTTHIGTLNVEPQHRNEHDIRQVYQHFQRKFNVNLWGGNGYKSGKRIGMIAFVHNRASIDDAHIHIGMWQLPLRYSDKQLEKEFHNAAQHTQGVLYRETLGPRRGNPAVHFERQYTEGWMNYCSRHLTDSSDANCLIELVQLPVNPHQLNP